MSNYLSGSRDLDRIRLSLPGEQRDFYFRRDSSDTRVIDQIFHENSYDLARLRRFDDLLRFVTRAAGTGKRPLIIDAGANIGASSLYFAAKFIDAVIVAIEPEFGNYQLLAENCRSLNVMPIHGALAATKTRAHIMDPGEGFWAYQTQLADRTTPARSVRTVTMNELYDAHASDCFPFIAKIDIEGGEMDVFRNNVEWVPHTPLLIVELHDWLLPGQRSSLPFLKCIAQLDRDFVYIQENVYSIANDLERLMPERVAIRAAQDTPTAIASLEEPLDDQLIAAMKDFQTSLEIVRSTDDELRTALAAVEAEKEQIHATLMSERAALHEAQHELAATHEELRSTREELQNARAEITVVHREQMLSERLEQTERALRDIQEQLRSTQGELTAVQTREKASTSELSLAITALQELRDQLDEGSRMNVSLQQELEATKKQIADLQTRHTSEVSSAAAAVERLKGKLQDRNQELELLRNHVIVRAAFKLRRLVNLVTART